LKEENRLDEAIESYRAALRLKPDHPHAYSNLGKHVRERTAVLYSKLWFLPGNALKDKGFVKEAIHCYVTAIRLMPSFAAAHSNLGTKSYAFVLLTAKSDFLPTLT
jgi:protein O-GlcNAc transferase